MFTLQPMAFRAGTKSYSVYDEQRRHRTGTSCSHIEYRAGAVGREELVNSIPVLTPEYLLPSKWIPVLAPTYSLPSKYLLTLHQSMQRTYPISDAPLLKLALGSFAPLQKSRQKHRSYVSTEALSAMVFAPAQGLFGEVRR